MRLVALGSPALIEGFALIGFETLPDSDSGNLERLLDQLAADRESAFLVIEHQLAEGNRSLLEQAHCRLPEVVIAEVPPLHAPKDYEPAIETMVRKLLGASALEGT